MATITRLQAGAEGLARKLEKAGIDCYVEVFRSGKWANSEASYVELTIEQKDCYLCVKWIANGYGACSTGDIAPDTIKEAKEATLALMGAEGFVLPS